MFILPKSTALENLYAMKLVNTDLYQAAESVVRSMKSIFRAYRI